MDKTIYCWNSDYSIADWGKYAQGYKKAVIILIEKYKRSTDPTLYKLLAFPIFFLYRHFIELLLKEIIISFIDLKNQKNKVPTTHNLSKLWKEVNPIIKELFFNLDGYLLKNRTNLTLNEIDHLEKTIMKLNLFDKESYSYRYPIDKNGNNSLYKEFEGSIEILKTEIIETFNLLDFIALMEFFLKYDEF